MKNIKLESFKSSQCSDAPVIEPGMIEFPTLFGGGGPTPNCIWVNDINEGAATSICQSLLKAAQDDPSRPVMMYINSRGGQADSMLAILNTMDAIPNKIVTVCIGQASSAGAVILSHGDMRFVAPHARVMVHELHGGAIGHLDDINNDTKEMRRINNQVMELLAKNCNVRGGYKALKKLLTTEQRDLNLSAKQAVEFGIVDGVGLPQLTKTTVWNLTFQGKKQ